MLRGTLVVTAAFVLLATAYLTGSMLALQPPRANIRDWLPIAALVAVQGSLTLATIVATPGSRWARWILVLGGVAIIWLGASWLRNTLAGAHFEGYAVLLGTALVVQGMLTLGVFAPLPQNAKTEATTR
jgi:hypothetical protein